LQILSKLDVPELKIAHPLGLLVEVGKRLEYLIAVVVSGLVVSPGRCDADFESGLQVDRRGKGGVLLYLLLGLVKVKLVLRVILDGCVGLQASEYLLDIQNPHRDISEMSN